MENRIDQLITFSPTEKYYVLDQGIYQGKSYLFTCEVNQDGTDVLDKFVIFEENVKNGKPTAKPVQDVAILEKLVKYFQKRQEETKDENS